MPGTVYLTGVSVTGSRDVSGSPEPGLIERAVHDSPVLAMIRPLMRNGIPVG